MNTTDAAATEGTSTEQALLSARLEVLLVVWQIREAIRAFPQAPDGLTTRRWNHGIARELWVAISALGLAAATEMAVPTLDCAGTTHCKPIANLLSSANWNTRRLYFNILNIDTEAYLSCSKINVDVFRGLENSPVYPKWWMWPNGGPGGGAHCPGWWSNPSEGVGAPMLVFESEKDDISHVAGHLYQCLSQFAVEKAAEMHEIEGEIAVEELEYSR